MERGDECGGHPKKKDMNDAMMYTNIKYLHTHMHGIIYIYIYLRIACIYLLVLLGVIFHVGEFPFGPPGKMFFPPFLKQRNPTRNPQNH